MFINTFAVHIWGQNLTSTKSFIAHFSLETNSVGKVIIIHSDPLGLVPTLVFTAGWVSQLSGFQAFFPDDAKYHQVLAPEKKYGFFDDGISWYFQMMHLTSKFQVALSEAFLIDFPLFAWLDRTTKPVSISTSMVSTGFPNHCSWDTSLPCGTLLPMPFEQP